MSAGNCCRSSSRWRRRGGEVAGWVVPGVILALLPKCPVCVAGYIAFATGIGVSLPTASWLRTSLLIGSVAALAYLAMRRLYRLLTPSRRIL